MKHSVLRGALAVLFVLAAALAACSTSSIDNGLDGLPPIAIRESERITLTSGAIGTTGLELTDADSGAAVSIPGGTVITLDASVDDSVPAVVPESIVVVLRPISQFLAAQDGDFLDGEGLNLTNLNKVGALAVLPLIAKLSEDIEITIPLETGTTGEVTIWRFLPDEITDADGELVALPTVGHWEFFATGTAVSNTVTFPSDSFGQFLVTTVTTGGGPGDNVPPTAELTATPLTSDTAPLTVNFDASGSADSDGTIATYDWDWEGDGTFDQETTTPNATHEYTTEDVFDPIVQVTDDDGATDTATVQITIGNAPPVVTDVQPLTATVGVETTITVTANDPDGTIANYAWDLDSNPADFETDRGADNTLVRTFDTPGLANLRVQVTDNEDGKTVHPVPINVTPVATGGPVISGFGPLTARLNEAATFTITATDDGTIANYEWDWEADGTFDDDTDAVNTIEHTFTTVGTHTVGVRVTDDEGNATPGSFSVTVTDEAAGPSATLTADPNEGELDAGELVVNFTTEVNPEGIAIEMVRYNFGEEGGDFVEETDETPLETSHTYTEAGVYTVTVEVTPTEGEEFTAETTVTVTEPAVANEPPTADFSWVRDGSNLLIIHFDGAASDDPDGSITSWSWDFDNDGTEDETGESVSHEFPAAGDYDVTLTVSDDNDPAAEDEITISVHAGPSS